MRLSGPEKLALADALKDVSFPTYLFGSRCDDGRRGGDVDVLILGRNLTDAQRLDLELKVAARFQSVCDEKIDVVVLDLSRLTPAEQAFLSVIGDRRFPLAA